MIYSGLLLLIALICFIIAAAKSPGNPWGWIGMAVLCVLAFLTKGKFL